ncbi:NAD-dependent deacylase [candidate division KSB3 bacterium]|uniref:NAD-dependent protein deacylase n=1 Tax=candidate division KSB3 bacterium TaxID=2044937 RepID=A0A2G6K832_9BACT|nr:MAG: NAD-dependent deacylase [candidate division KSB3 bacterium]
MKKIVVFTGSGVSAPSGLDTFRDEGGIWSRYRIEEVATPEAWQSDPGKVTEFYNLRRAQLERVKPNPAHYAIAELEKKYDVTVVTQNVDDLHERGGSSRVLHLHGELCKARSDKGGGDILDIGYRKIELGERHPDCSAGGVLRPHIVWFGEPVLGADEAVQVIRNCDIIIVVGTSLQVYPAAGFVEEAPVSSDKYLVDLDSLEIPDGYTVLRGSADALLPELVCRLLEEADG